MRLKKLLSRILTRPTANAARAAETPAEQPSLAAKVEQIFQAQFPRVFALVSWGYAATGWVSKALNAHPEILCVHGLNYSQGRYLNSSQPLTDCQYLKLLRDAGVGYTLVGDVHGISTVSSLPALEREFKEGFRSAILVRDPERRVLSFVGIFEQYDYDDRVWPGLEYVQQLAGFPQVARHYGDKKKRFFMHAANMLNLVLDEKKHAPIFRSEDLTTNPDALVQLVSHLSAGQISPSIEWARSMIALPRINRHKRSGGHDGLEDWQVEIMRALVKPESCQAYAEFGYQLSKNWSTAPLLPSNQKASLLGASDAA